MSTAKIFEDGVLKGTAWLIHERHVATAAHCVGAVNSVVQVRFWNVAAGAFDPEIDATVVVRDGQLDGALLRLAVPQPEIEVLAVSRRGAAASKTDWHAFGFPAAAEGRLNGYGVSGGVEVMRASLQRPGGNVGGMQLNCREALETSQPMVDDDGNQVHILSGMSGAAIRITERTDRVVGLVRCAVSPLPAGTIFATPIELLWDQFHPHLPGIQLHAWDLVSGFVRPNPAQPGSIICSVDDEFVVSAWTAGMVKDLTVDIPWSDAGPLVSAVLRLVLHQGKITRLHVRSAEPWAKSLHRAADRWIVLRKFDPTGLHNPCVECKAPCDQMAPIFPSAAEAAQAIHAACDRWILEKLNAGLDVLFASDRRQDIAGYAIAADVLAQMETTWRTWYARLRAQPRLLHSFFLLILTHEGSHDGDREPSPGAGPLTYDDCILPAVIFSLAVSPFLPEPLMPKYPQPGNLVASAAAHACGIRAIKRLPLDEELRGHCWSTRIVLLDEVNHSVDEWQMATQSLVSGGADPRATFSRLAPTTLLITRDLELRKAIATGVPAVRKLLADRETNFAAIQKKYMDDGAPPL